MKSLIALLLSAGSIAHNLVAEANAQGEVAECRDCVIGIFDDPNLTRHYGYWDVSKSPVKSIYVGIRYPEPLIAGLTGIELSVDGIPDGSRIPLAQGLPAPTIVIGRDIRTHGGESSGGINMAWAGCQRGDRALVQIDMVRFEPVPNDVVLTIHPRFPQSDPSVGAPLFTQCNRPIYTRTLVSTQCYVLNPSLPWPPPICTTSIEPSTWTRVKSLYRD